MIIEKKFIKKIISYVALIITIWLIYSFHSNYDIFEISDDAWFKNAGEYFRLIDFLKWRYFNWSARLLPDTVAYLFFKLPILYWRIFNTALIVLLGYSISRIFNKGFKLLAISSSLFILGYMSFNVIYSGYFWITGSFNYLLPMAIGMFVMIPYADSYFREIEPQLSVKIVINLLIVCLFSVSNEQVLACALGAAFCYHIATYIQKKSQNIIMILSTGIMLLGFILMYISPGNKFRFIFEEAKYLPGFSLMSLSGRTKLGIFWLYQELSRNMTMSIILITILTIIITKYEWYKKLLVVLSTLMITLYNVYPKSIMDFESRSKIPFSQFLNLKKLISIEFLNYLCPFILWTLFFSILIICILSNTDYPIFISLCFLAAFTSCILMFFSPTIYASGPRVFNCFGLILSIISFYLFQKIIEKFNNEGYPTFVLGIFPVVTFIAQYIKLKQQ